MLIQLNNVTKNFVVNEIFSNVKLEINDKYVNLSLDSFVN